MANDVDQKFTQELYGRLSTLFERAIGHSLDLRQIDRLNDESRKLAELINKQINTVAQARALAVCKLLNDATSGAFKIVAEEDEKLRVEIAELRERQKYTLPTNLLHG